VILLPTFPILGAGDSDSQATRELEEKVVPENLFFESLQLQLKLTRGFAQVSRVEAYRAGDNPLAAVRASVKPPPRATPFAGHGPRIRAWQPIIISESHIGDCHKVQEVLQVQLHKQRVRKGPASLRLPA
jgi:hypothetical protein